MLLAIAFLLLSVALGFGLFERLKLFDSALECFAFGAPAGIAVSSFIVLGTYVLQHGFTNVVFYVSLLIIALLLFLLYKNALFDRKARASLRKIKITNMPARVVYIALLVYGIIAFVLLTSLYVSNNTLYCLGPAICSDLMYHIGVGNSIIYSGFPPRYPFTVQALNIFPFINDFYSALLLKYGLGLSQSIIVPDLLLFFSAVVATTELAYMMLKNKFATLAAMLIFWFGSDFIMAFILYPLNSVFPSISFSLPPLQSLLTGYGIKATGFQALLDSMNFILSGWTSLLYQNLLPQRGFLLALPIGVSLLYFAYEFIYKKRKFTHVQLAFVGVLAGLLPLIHPITLMVIGFVAIYLFLKVLTDKKQMKQRLSSLLYALLPALILIIVQLAYMTRQRVAAGSYSFVFQQYYHLGGGIVQTIFANLVSVPMFWIAEVGLPLLLAIIGYWYASKETRSFLVPFLALWVFFTIFSVQTNSADSNKIFNYVFLMLSVLDGCVLAKLYGKGPALKLLAIVLILATILNFANTYAYWAASPYAWISSAEINASRYIMNNTSTAAIFAVNDPNTLLQPVPSLGARQTLLSIEPYVQDDEYTYPPELLLANNTQLFSNGDCNMIKRLNVSYIYLDTSYANETKPFMNRNFALVFNQTDVQKHTQIYIYRALC